MNGGRLWGLVAATMMAFAANSLLNRLAVGAGHIDALSFAVIRVIAGAVMLSVLVLASGARPQLPPLRRFWAAGCLSLYLLGFSVAYVHLDAGLGALILFGTVQVVMFAVGLIGGEVIPLRRWLGMGLAFAGLMVLSWPSGAVGGVIGTICMVTAGIGWGVYSLLGRGSQDPLPETAAAFLIAVPLVWLPVLLQPVATDATPISAMGYGLAILSGAVTSGLGYALWYRVLPQLGASTAALVQLSAPLLAVIGGIILLGEALSGRLLLASVLILGGIALGLVQRRIGSNGS